MVSHVPPSTALLSTPNPINIIQQWTEIYQILMNTTNTSASTSCAISKLPKLSISHLNQGILEEWIYRHLLYLVSQRPNISEKLWNAGVNLLCHCSINITIILIKDEPDANTPVSQIEYTEDNKTVSLLAQIWQRLLSQIFAKNRSNRIGIMKLLNSIVHEACASNLFVADSLYQYHIEQSSLLLQEDEDIEIQKLALDALINFQVPLVHNLFILFMKESSPLLRKVALRGVAFPNDSEAFCKMCKAFLDRTFDACDDVRQVVYNRLLHASDWVPLKLKFQFLQAGLNDSSITVKKSCVTMLNNWIYFAGGMAGFVNSLYKWNMYREDLIDICLAAYMLTQKNLTTTDFSFLKKPSLVNVSTAELFSFRIYQQLHCDKNSDLNFPSLRLLLEVLKTTCINYEEWHVAFPLSEIQSVAFIQTSTIFAWRLRQTFLLLLSSPLMNVCRYNFSVIVEEIFQVCKHILLCGPMGDSEAKVFFMCIPADASDLLLTTHDGVHYPWPFFSLHETCFHAILKLMKYMETFLHEDGKSDEEIEQQYTKRISSIIGDIINPLEENWDERVNTGENLIASYVHHYSLKALTALLHAASSALNLEMKQEKSVISSFENSTSTKESLFKNLSLLQQMVTEKWRRILFIMEAFLSYSNSHTKHDAALNDFPASVILPALQFIMEHSKDEFIQSADRKEDYLYLLFIKCSTNFCFLSDSMPFFESQIRGLGDVFSSTMDSFCFYLEHPTTLSFETKIQLQQQTVYADVYLRSLGDLLLLHPHISHFEKGKAFLILLWKILFGEILCSKYIQSTALHIIGKWLLTHSLQMDTDTITSSFPLDASFLPWTDTLRGLFEMIFLTPTLSQEQIHNLSELTTLQVCGYTAMDKKYLLDSLSVYFSISSQHREWLCQTFQSIILNSFTAASSQNILLVKNIHCMCKFILSYLKENGQLEELLDYFDKLIRGILLLMIEQKPTLNDQCGISAIFCQMIPLWINEGFLASAPTSSLLKTKIMNQLILQKEDISALEDIYKTQILLKYVLKRPCVKQKSCISALEKILVSLATIKKEIALEIKENSSSLHIQESLKKHCSDVLKDYSYSEAVEAEILQSLLQKYRWMLMHRKKTLRISYPARCLKVTEKRSKPLILPKLCKERALPFQWNYAPLPPLKPNESSLDVIVDDFEASPVGEKTLQSTKKIPYHRQTTAFADAKRLKYTPIVCEILPESKTQLFWS
ncbi:hypothetical protein IE077_000677 [Cardiosporidium cionae]|uniref:Uncharacterized protein n=1 Tax=Cardiosporidium cionae TaxID=476202 RepID=A0ABQ7JGG6_9APIC|nr:hypothetical protein IE077_000677 [Cardiosporidium cionae]|eukprot:KAF8823078.1 hypothetical protein IE077_000677 [Cardiosporidium cionae]